MKRLFIALLVVFAVLFTAACGITEEIEAALSMDGDGDNSVESTAAESVEEHSLMSEQGESSETVSEESSGESSGESSVDISDSSAEEDDILTDGDYGYTLDNGMATIVKYSGQGGAVVLPDTLGGNPVTVIGESAFAGNGDIVEVTVGDDAVKIADNAFKGCAKLAKVSLGNGVAAVSPSAFDGCDSLAAIEVAVANSFFASVDGVLYNYTKTELVRFPEGHSSTEYSVPVGTLKIGESAFRSCSRLESLTLPDGCALSVGSFFHCDNLGSVTLGAEVGEVPENCFFGCVLLEELELTEGVTSLGSYAFFGCVALERISLPSTLTAIADNSFECCSALEKIEAEGEFAEQWYEDTGKKLIENNKKEQ
ncbi:MAG: leucine-rich repeat protein [Clostridia bacterium]|nr:leucine-rich repeat protein [Clostridia bacterium]